jgi:hypothetical protein
MWVHGEHFTVERQLVSRKGNRSVPCFMVKEGVGSSKKPTTFAGVPAATVLHD